MDDHTWITVDVGGWTDFWVTGFRLILWQFVHCDEDDAMPVCTWGLTHSQVYGFFGVSGKKKWWDEVKQRRSLPAYWFSSELLLLLPSCYKPDGQKDTVDGPLTPSVLKSSGLNFSPPSLSAAADVAASCIICVLLLHLVLSLIDPWPDHPCSMCVCVGPRPAPLLSISSALPPFRNDPLLSPHSPDRSLWELCAVWNKMSLPHWILSSCHGPRQAERPSREFDHMLQITNMNYFSNWWCFFFTKKTHPPATQWTVTSF